jgi:hypothetical protein
MYFSQCFFSADLYQWWSLFNCEFKLHHRLHIRHKTIQFRSSPLEFIDTKHHEPGSIYATYQSNIITFSYITGHVIKPAESDFH